jgi:hypothetical protein
MSLTAQLHVVQNANEGELELSTQSVGRICADRRSQAVIRVLADCGPLSFDSLATVVARRYHNVNDVSAIDSDLREENCTILQHKYLRFKHYFQWCARQYSIKNQCRLCPSNSPRRKFC